MAVENISISNTYLCCDFNSERSVGGGIIGASGSEIIGYKSQPPNNTIMIRGLAQHITENDVRYINYTHLQNSLITKIIFSDKTGYYT